MPPASDMRQQHRDEEEHQPVETAAVPVRERPEQRVAPHRRQGRAGGALAVSGVGIGSSRRAGTTPRQPARDARVATPSTQPSSTSRDRPADRAGALRASRFRAIKHVRPADAARRARAPCGLQPDETGPERRVRPGDLFDQEPAALAEARRRSARRNRRADPRGPNYEERHRASAGAIAVAEPQPPCCGERSAGSRTMTREREHHTSAGVAHRHSG